MNTEWVRGMRKIYTLAGSCIDVVPEDWGCDKVQERIEKKIGLAQKRQWLFLNDGCWYVIVQDVLWYMDPAARSFAWDFEGNPIKGSWRSASGLFVIDAAPMLNSRLRYVEVLSPRNGAKEQALHALLSPEGLSEGRMWWKAELHLSPFEEIDYLCGDWWYSDTFLVGEVWLSAIPDRKQLELRADSLHSSGIVCEEAFFIARHTESGKLTES